MYIYLDKNVVEISNNNSSILHVLFSFLVLAIISCVRYIFNRPGVVGAVLQTPLPLINKLIQGMGTIKNPISFDY